MSQTSQEDQAASQAAEEEVAGQTPPAPAAPESARPGEASEAAPAAEAPAGAELPPVPRGAGVIREALAHLPQEPGVYLMRDAKGRIIYVGKAKRLRARVASYARQEAFPNYYRQKVQAMVARVAAVEYVVTHTEKEALLLENTLIKKHRPRYNIDLRDDKNHLMFRLSLEHEFPRLSVVRKPANDKAKYFGPFDSAMAARQTLRILQRIFPLRRCSDRAVMSRKRPCLDYDTGLCTAPCTGRITPEEYQALAAQLARFFAGEGQAVVAELKKLMAQASADQDYELAALYRDRMQALARTLERQQVYKPAGDDLDALALHDDGRGYRLARLKFRAGRLADSQVFDLPVVAGEPGEALGQALLVLYDEHKPPPGLLLVSHMPADPGLVGEVLAERAGRKVELRIPQRGEKKGYLDLAAVNAARPRVAKAEDPEAILEGLARKLGLAEPPQQMECMDISHLGGRLTVASVVAMMDGELAKDLYRRYKIIGPEGAPDDYAAMAEVVSRRLGGDRPPPDLLVLDGGKGQLGVAVAVCQGLSPERRPALCALAKGRGEGPDKVYLPGRKNPVALAARDPGLLMLMRLRDEAHRFAVSYHRLLRRKALTKSILEEVPGVGPKKRGRLLATFGSLAALKRASADDMRDQAGVDAATAQRVEAFLAALDTETPPK